MDADDLLSIAKEMGQNMEEAIKHRNDILSRHNDFVKCPKCGWEAVNTVRKSCAGCGCPVVKKENHWEAKSEKVETPSSV